MSSKTQIVDMVHKREQVWQAMKKVNQQHELMIEREQQYRTDIQHLLDWFEQQVQRIEQTNSKISQHRSTKFRYC